MGRLMFIYVLVTGAAGGFEMGGAAGGTSAAPFQPPLAPAAPRVILELVKFILQNTLHFQKI